MHDIVTNKKRVGYQMKQIVIFAGPNGSGKSTVNDKFRQHRGLFELPDTEINPDDIAEELKIQMSTLGISGDPKNPIALQAARYAESMREAALRQGESFIFETVLSMRDKLDFLHRAKTAGYIIRLVYVTTNSPDINALRVQQRVASGGHDVPTDKIYQRYNRSMELLHEVICIADEAIVINNSAPQEQHSIEVVLTKEEGVIKLYTPRQGRPEWVNEKIAVKLRQMGVAFQDMPAEFSLEEIRRDAGGCMFL